MVLFGIRYWTLASLLLISKQIAVASNTNLNRTNALNYRLPTSNHPISYHISLLTRIDLGIFDFSGVVTIRISVDQTSNEIILHSSQLTISNISLTRIEGSTTVPVNILSPELDNDAEFLKIKTENVLLNVGDQVILQITYNGTLRTNVDGFFRTSYQSFDGTQM